MAHRTGARRLALLFLSLAVALVGSTVFVALLA